MQMQRYFLEFIYLLLHIKYPFTPYWKVTFVSSDPGKGNIYTLFHNSSKLTCYLNHTFGIMVFNCLHKQYFSSFFRPRHTIDDSNSIPSLFIINITKNNNYCLSSNSIFLVDPCCPSTYLSNVSLQLSNAHLFWTLNQFFECRVLKIN